MNLRKTLFVIICSFFVVINVNATCDSSKLKELKEIAQKVEFTYDFTTKEESNLDEGDYLIVDFKITAFNLNDRIKPLIIQNYYMDDYREFKYNLSKQSSLSGFSSGENVKITFKAYTNDECAGQTVFTKTISLPYYNMFYHSNDCLEHPDFKYCQSELLTSSVSNRQFYNELQKFLNTNNKNDDEIIDNNNNNNTRFNVNEIIGFVIMIVMILVLIMLIVLKIKKERKKRSL